MIIVIMGPYGLKCFTFHCPCTDVNILIPLLFSICRRYFFLITFRSYLYGDCASKTGFTSWMEARPELGHLCDNLRFDKWWIFKHRIISSWQVCRECQLGETNVEDCGESLDCRLFDGSHKVKNNSTDWYLLWASQVWRLSNACLFILSAESSAVCFFFPGHGSEMNIQGSERNILGTFKPWISNSTWECNSCLSTRKLRSSLLQE